MADVFTKEKRSWIMSRVKSTRTKVENLFESLLKKEGIKYKRYPRLAGRPDFLIGNDIVVFVDGCFWHKCPKHFRNRLLEGTIGYLKSLGMLKGEKAYRKF